ncbi:MAG: hypothetical protein EBR09_11720 [Proteobacteria bacterium]|nr:hypothetical protein [Pseudomonadota bacterium]
MGNLRRIFLLRSAVAALLALSCRVDAGGFKLRDTLELNESVTVPLTWLKPDQNGTPSRALVILQHGMMRNAEKMMSLAQSLVERNIEVLLPSIKDPQYMDPLFPEMFVDAFEKKFGSGRSQDIPSKILLAGFSAGARFLTHAANLFYQKQREIRGILLLDPVVGDLPEQQLGPRLPLPYFAILAKPSRCNANGNAFPLFESGRFEVQGFRLKSASHCDFEGRSSDAVCYMYCGSSPRQNAEAVKFFATEWLTGLIDSQSPHTDYLPGGKVFLQWQNQGLFDSIFSR